MLDRLVDTVKRICHPKKGCDWINGLKMRDLAPYTLEETHELIDALENNDMPNLREELGDLLYHIFLYAQKAEDEGHFTLDDVASDVADKMQRRKPWVFDESTQKEGVDWSGAWERIKAEEKKAKGQSHTLLGNIPRSMPSLAAAHQIQRKVCKAGFRWEDMDAYFPKIHEELDEVKEAVEIGDPEHIEEEFGDVLFTVAILGWFLKLDPELTLRRANKKFIRRFNHVEKSMVDQGMPLNYENLPKMEAFWQEAKKLEKEEAAAKTA